MRRGGIGIKDSWYEENAPEFYIDNFPDVTKGGKKKQCLGYHKWDYIKSLTTEDGICFYHHMCEKLE